MPNSRIILGIDPGYARMGWGVICVTGQAHKLLEYGCFETYKDEELGVRLAQINEELTKIIDRHKPTDIAIEELFFAKNTKTAMSVAAARGIILMRSYYHTGKIFEYKPNQVKQATTGTGAADKKQIQFMVTKILGLAKTPKPDDAADALAIAITHAAYVR